jgi:ATP/maltotriose-dependent transcriptional regulator MalT
MSLTMREHEIIGLIAKGFSQRGKRRPVDIELSTT